MLTRLLPPGNSWRQDLDASLVHGDDLDWVEANGVSADGLVAGGQNRILVNLADNILPPTAVAGPDQSIHASTAVSLDGNGSFDDTAATPDPEFAWSFTAKPANSSTTLSGANTATPSFVADVPGEFRVQLIVTGEADNPSAPDEVAVSSLNLAPTAAAGDDQVVVVNAPAQLDRLSSTDADNDPLTFAWTLSLKPTRSTAVLAGANTPTPSLTPDSVGDYTVQLVVNDGFSSSIPDTVTITAISGTDLAERCVQEASVAGNNLPDSAFQKRGHRKSVAKRFASIVKALQKNDTPRPARSCSRQSNVSMASHYGARQTPRARTL